MVTNSHVMTLGGKENSMEHHFGGSQTNSRKAPNTVICHTGS